MIFALANRCQWRMVAKVHLRILANPLAKACESMTCVSLLRLAKHCETLVLLPKHICESLQKYMHSALANPYENTICETLRKVYFLLAPPHCSGRAQSTPCISSGHPQQLQTLRHHDPQTHLKRRLPLLCLPQRLHFFWAATGRLAPAP